MHTAVYLVITYLLHPQEALMLGPTRIFRQFAPLGGRGWTALFPFHFSLLGMNNALAYGRGRSRYDARNTHSRLLVLANFSATVGLGSSRITVPDNLGGLLEWQENAEIAVRRCVGVHQPTANTLRVQNASSSDGDSTGETTFLFFNPPADG